MKSSRQIDTENKVNQAYEYAVSFYNKNNRGLENQLICLKEMMKLTGFDDKTCVQIQNPILALYSASDIIDLSHQTIRQHMNITSQNIHSRLLDSQLSTSYMPSHPKFNTSTPHIGLESYYGKDEKGNCIIAEKFSSILKQDPSALSKIKVITIADTNMDDKAISSFSDVIQHQVFNLDGFYFHNNKIGDNGVFRLLHGVINAPEWRNIVKIDLSNNKIGDKGAYYLSDSLTYGQLPNTRYLDVSGNDLSWEGNSKLAKMVQNTKQTIKVLVNRVLNINTIIEGGKKQSDLFFGSKEEKHAIIKDYLKQAQNNGVDTKNVVVSKSIFNNKVKLGIKFLFGWVKCNVVPEDATSLVVDVIVAKTSKKATGVLTVTEAVACYFETFDESASSQEGVQYMLDAGYVTQTDLLGNVE